ncbi:restriction endonuclease subunit S [Streptococcus salivarius]
MEKPKIRFGKFNNKWKKNKLDKVVDFFDNQRIPIDSGERKAGPYPYYGASGIIDYVDGYIFDGEYVLLAEDGANIILRSSPIAYLSKGKFWLNNHAHIMKMKTGSNGFLIQLLEKQNYEKYNTGTAQPKLNGDVVKNITLHFPSDEEQSAIGSLFRTLDDLLTSYKDNLTNYQSLKATMLSKMFPKTGQTVPEIRLDGFEDEWELLEINDLADDFQSGGTPKTNVQEYWDGDIPWIQSSDLETNCLFEIKVQKSISEKGLKNSSAKIIPKDSIAVVTRVGVGKLAVMRHEYATSQDFLSLSNLKSNIEFTAYLLYRLLQKEVTQLQGTSIKGITKVELLSKKVLIPSLPEQQAIGTYFTNLDNLISAHQEKITQLETLKKKLLQDMFI